MGMDLKVAYSSGSECQVKFLNTFHTFARDPKWTPSWRQLRRLNHAHQPDVVRPNWSVPTWHQRFKSSAYVNPAHAVSTQFYKSQKRVGLSKEFDMHA